MRRDEEKAAEEEKARQERIAIAVSTFTIVYCSFLLLLVDSHQQMYYVWSQCMDIVSVYSSSLNSILELWVSPWDHTVLSATTELTPP